MTRLASSPSRRIKTRSGEWWVADEEPELLSAGRSDRPMLARRKPLMMAIVLAAAAACSAILLWGASAAGN